MNKYDVSQQLAEIRDKNIRAYHYRVRKLEEKSPEYRELSNRRTALLSEAAICTISGNKEKAEANRREAEALDRREKEILRELNLDDDYLEIHYNCPICQDKGFTPEGGMCSCLKQLIHKARFNEYDLTERFIDDTFENFDLSIFSDNPLYADKNLGEKYTPRFWIQFLKEMAQDYCRNFDEEKKSLMFYGPVGTGKTYLISCMVNELIDRDVDLIYISAANLISLIFDDINQKTQLKRSNRERLKNVDVLIIDDLGTEGSSEFNANLISEILDERMLNGKKTIITTNYTPQEMAKGRYPERMVSRIMKTFDFFKFIGPDLRSQFK